MLGGMWGSPQRFNVAITRARALLVAVGHPAVLMEVCFVCSATALRVLMPGIQTTAMGAPFTSVSCFR